MNATAVKTRKQRDLARRKELIIQKSKELFLERGFDAVTVQDICNAIEYGRSVFYSHFLDRYPITAWSTPTERG